METLNKTGAFVRLVKILQEKGIAIPDFQRTMDISSQNWNNWRTRGMPSDAIFKVAEYLKINPVWLKSGTGQQYLTNGARHGYIDRREQTNERVPLIAWVPEDDEDKTPIDWLLCPVPHSRNTFALKVESDAMVGTGMQTYPPGTFLFVDKESPVTSGCRVIARLPDGSITFRELWIDSGKRILKPLNGLYSMMEIDDNTSIIGKVIGKFLAE